MTDNMTKEFLETLDKIPVEKYSDTAIKADELIIDKTRLYSIGQIIKRVNPIIDASDKRVIIDEKEFDLAYEIIAEALVEACVETKRQRVANKKMSLNDPIPDKPYAVPMLIRKICYYLVYKAYALQLHNSNYTSKDLHDLGYQYKVLEKIKEKYVPLAKKSGAVNPSFALQAFNKDKWCMYPLEDFLRGALQTISSSSQYTIPNVPLTYAGKKNGLYGFMLTSLADQVSYNTFVDVFGGSGAGTMNLEPVAGRSYYINDFDRCNYNFYRVLSSRYDEFIAECKAIQRGIKDLSDSSVWVDYKIGINNRVVKNIAEGKAKQEKAFKDIDKKSIDNSLVASFHGISVEELVNSQDYMDLVIACYKERPLDWGDIDIYEVCTYYGMKFADLVKSKDYIEKLIRFVLEVEDFKDAQTGQNINGVKDNDIKRSLKSIVDHDSTNSDKIKYVKGLWYRYKRIDEEYRVSTQQISIDAAVAFFFLHSFMAGGGKDIDLGGVVEESVNNFLNYNMDVIFLGYHERIKVCTARNEDGVELFREMSTGKETLFYVDPPYIATSGYPTYFDKDKMLELVSSLAITEGNWIYSCRAGVVTDTTNPYKEPSAKVAKARKSICELFFWFLKISEERPLYVLFKGSKLQSPAQVLDAHISWNTLLEVMITDIDFAVPDISKYTGNRVADDEIFVKMTMEDYFKAVEYLLIPPVEAE